MRPGASSCVGTQKLPGWQAHPKGDFQGQAESRSSQQFHQPLSAFIIMLGQPDLRAGGLLSLKSSNVFKTSNNHEKSYHQPDLAVGQNHPWCIIINHDTMAFQLVLFVILPHKRDGQKPLLVFVPFLLLVINHRIP